MKGVYLFLADGFEEIEALATIDILRRGGVNVRTVSIYSDRVLVNGAHSIEVSADMNYLDFRAGVQTDGTNESDVMIFPGGLPGAEFLSEHADLMDIMKEHYSYGGTVAAICAAPGLVLSQLRSLEGIKFTCYDGFENAPMSKGGEYVKAPAVIDNNVITGRGPGCAIEFGLSILMHLKGEEAAQKVSDGMLFSAEA